MKSDIRRAYLVPALSLELELLGNHKGRVMRLEESLLIRPGVERTDARD